MSKEKNKVKNVKLSLKDLEMSPEEMLTLEEMLDDITQEAKNVVEDYVKNPSEERDENNITQVHSDSNILKTREERLITPDTIKKDINVKKNLDKKKKRS